MPDQNQQPPAQNPAPQPVSQLDMIIAKFQLWVENMEKQHAEARARAAERAHVPDDVPRFVTRPQ